MNENPETPLTTETRQLLAKRLGADGTLVPAPPLNTCQVCGETIAPEADAQDYCNRCSPDAPLEVLDDPHPCSHPLPADLLPPQTRIASVRIAVEAPHLTGDGGAAPDMGAYARRDRVNALARRIFEQAAAGIILRGPGYPSPDWQAAAGEALAAARAFEQEAHNG